MKSSGIQGKYWQQIKNVSCEWPNYWTNQHLSTFDKCTLKVVSLWMVVYAVYVGTWLPTRTVWPLHMKVVGWIQLMQCLYRFGQMRDIQHGGYSQISRLEPSCLWSSGLCLFMQSSCGWGRDVVHMLSSYDCLSQVQLFCKVGNSCNIQWLCSIGAIVIISQACFMNWDCKDDILTVIILYVPLSPHNWVIVIENDTKDIIS